MKKQKLLHIGKTWMMAAITLVLLAGCDNRYLIFNPKGPVAQKEYDLIIFSIILCAIVVIPVLGLLVYIVVRYRDTPGNKAPYTPNWDDSKTLEIVWWGIPIVIIGILGFYTAKTTYDLVEPPQKDVEPIMIEVTSLDWKWLFTYPEENIATVNYVQIPEDVPVQFVLTSDAPMNSFWVPELGGQVYTMPGMAMGLWLQADHSGKFFGSGANFSGEGFAHMTFTVEAKPKKEFEQWAKEIKQSAPALTTAGYKELAQQGISNKKYFGSFPEGLFRTIVDKNGGHYYNHLDHYMTTDTIAEQKMNASHETHGHDE